MITINKTWKKFLPWVVWVSGRSMESSVAWSWQVRQMTAVRSTGGTDKKTLCPHSTPQNKPKVLKFLMQNIKVCAKGTYMQSQDHQWKQLPWWLQQNSSQSAVYDGECAACCRNRSSEDASGRCNSHTLRAAREGYSPSLLQPEGRDQAQSRC